MKNIFKEAHEMTRKMKERYPEVDYQTQFGLYVSYLFEEGKEEEEVKELKGTPKQIAWAEDIRTKFLKQIGEAEERIADRQNEKADTYRAMFANAREKIVNIEDSAWFIDNRNECGISIAKILLKK
ncbi:hypothetical protein [Anaerosalibacter sp. Marseille-P3206]|uniref:hypothetical protein n=1 Tax=Anaerosalibacter sp. Marseille-P3206 TaxID=1871005 RepID=UPI0009846C7F|nr:hypothetical protein [Anaerosalibacter sp. Marseille-P3206]